MEFLHDYRNISHRIHIMIYSTNAIVTVLDGIIEIVLHVVPRDDMCEKTTGILAGMRPQRVEQRTIDSRRIFFAVFFLIRMWHFVIKILLLQITLISHKSPEDNENVLYV